jgi:hypothetical protein
VREARPGSLVAAQRGAVAIDAEDVEAAAWYEEFGASLPLDVR